jgi:hypothetical protein
LNFKEWREGIEALEAKVKRGTLFDISEAIGVGGTVVTITIGKNGLHVEEGDYRADIKQLRSLFTHNKEEFEDLLDVLTERVDKGIESTEGILEQVVAPIIPDAVIQRLKGDAAGDADNKDLLQQMVKKGLQEIADTFFKRVQPFDSFNINFREVNELPFVLAYSNNRFVLEVCGCHVDSMDPEDGNPSNDMETCLFFLANLESIKKKLQSFFDNLMHIHR